jgi:hypothetical protein
MGFQNFHKMVGQQKSIIFVSIVHGSPSIPYLSLSLPVNHVKLEVQTRHTSMSSENALEHCFMESKLNERSRQQLQVKIQPAVRERGKKKDK